jgi:hypothetical protein
VPVFVVEANHRAISGIETDDIAAAETYVVGPGFLTSLRIRKLWDGTTPLAVRPATPPEIAKWRHSVSDQDAAALALIVRSPFFD